MNKVKQLDEKYGNVETINLELMNAKNKAIGYGAAAVIQKNMLIIASVQLNAQIMSSYVKSLGDSDTAKKINRYDEIAKNCYSATNAIDKLFNENVLKWTITGSAYETAMTSLDSSETKTEDILVHTSKLLSTAETSESTLSDAISKLGTVSNVYASCKETFEGFNNNLPGKMDSDKMTSLIEAGDYESAVIKTALEADIVSNHMKFAKDRSSFESGGGIPSVRDDPNDINPWIGIIGKPSYRKSNGTSAEISSEPLKSIPSEFPDSLMTKSSLRISTTNY
jgi:hypothetical protein